MAAAAAAAAAAEAAEAKQVALAEHSAQQQAAEVQAAAQDTAAQQQGAGLGKQYARQQGQGQTPPPLLPLPLRQLVPIRRTKHSPCSACVQSKCTAKYMPFNHAPKP